MKNPIIFMPLVWLFTSCVTDSTGNKHYTGPTVSFSAGFNGITAGVTLVGDPVLPPIKLPAPSGK